MASSSTDMSTIPPLEVINLTPHEINFYARDSENLPTKVVSIPSSGELRLKNINIPLPNLKIAVSGVHHSLQQNPSPEYDGFIQEGKSYQLFANYNGPPVIFLVSMVVGLYLQHHKDTIPSGCSIYGPDTSPNFVVRGESGILGSYASVHYARSSRDAPL